MPKGEKGRIDASRHGPANFLACLLFRESQFIGLLQVHPELRTGPEPLAEPECRVRGDSALAINDLCHSIRRDMELLAKLVGIDSKFQKFVSENLAGMDGYSSHRGCLLIIGARACLSP
jgi:hypothetical protein